jgi:hypothetical protein
MQQPVTAQASSRWRLQGGQILNSVESRDLYSVTEIEPRNRTREPDGRSAAAAEAASAPAAADPVSAGAGHAVLRKGDGGGGGGSRLSTSDREPAASRRTNLII